MILADRLWHLTPRPSTGRRIRWSFWFYAALCEAGPEPRRCFYDYGNDASIQYANPRPFISNKVEGAKYACRGLYKYYRPASIRQIPTLGPSAMVGAGQLLRNYSREKDEGAEGKELSGGVFFASGAH